MDTHTHAHREQTIFSLSSGALPAGIAVVRLSGPAALTALQALCRDAPLPAPRRMAHRALYAADGEELLDRALVVYFPAPHSATGEDCAELHLHGSIAVLAAIVDVLGTLEGLRPAQAGEFSRRAYDNQKLDLTRAEGLADLLAAETPAQRRQAMRQLSGHLMTRCRHWQETLVRAQAHIEGSIDFADEDLPDTLDDTATRIIRTVYDEITAALADERAGERVRDGLHVAIIGPPNAGKSSLLNRLAGREAAIVSPLAGTTRDTIEVACTLDGFPVTFTDTAGLHDSTDAIEQEGIRRTQDAIRTADVCVYVEDITTIGNGTTPCETTAHGTRLAMEAMDESLPLIRALSKHDLAPHVSIPPPTIAISVKTDTGMDSLLDAVKAHLAPVRSHDSPLITRARHRHALAECQEHLARALQLSQTTISEAALWAEDLRLARRSLGHIMGQSGVEDVLDVLFSEFCIGK